MEYTPPCTVCGADRSYELQLLSNTIDVLENAGKTDVLNQGIEWGTIIVVTCSRDCNLYTSVQNNKNAMAKYGYARELVNVQWEETL